MLERLGPAVNSGRSIFLYGAPGNGKTVIAESVGQVVLGAEMYIPYAVEAGGMVIKIFDPVSHRLVPEDEPFDPADSRSMRRRPDQRWFKVNRPVITTGGELTLETLDLVWDDVAMYYEAPFQMKANGGMFLIDDFGRQQMRPTDLLNRWIVPLETQIDFFRLQTGQTFQLPFRQLIVFATNLDPEALVDDAFLRRIQIKVEVTRPDEKLFYRLFATMCQQVNVPFDKDSFVHLLREWYHKTGRRFQAVHPRDILKGVVALCEYEGIPNQLNPQLIDEACVNYFVRPQSSDS
jgi:predicted ATPase with chaperone activity